MFAALVRLMVAQFRSRASLVAENELLRQQLAGCEEPAAAQASDVHPLAALDDCAAGEVDGLLAGDGDAGAAGHCASGGIGRVSAFCGDGGHELAAEGRRATRR